MLSFSFHKRQIKRQQTFTLCDNQKVGEEGDGRGEEPGDQRQGVGFALGMW